MVDAVQYRYSAAYRAYTGMYMGGCWWVVGQWCIWVVVHMHIGVSVYTHIGVHHMWYIT